MSMDKRPKFVKARPACLALRRRREPLGVYGITPDFWVTVWPSVPENLVRSRFKGLTRRIRMSFPRAEGIHFPPLSPRPLGRRRCQKKPSSPILAFHHPTDRGRNGNQPQRHPKIVHTPRSYEQRKPNLPSSHFSFAIVGESAAFVVAVVS